MLGMIIPLLGVLIAVAALYIINLGIKLWQGYKFYTSQGLEIDFFYPITGHFHYIRKGITKYDDPVYYLKEIMRKQPKNQIILSNVGFRPLLFLADPELIKEFLITKYELYNKDTQASLNLSNFLENGLLFTEGYQWKTQRKLISQAFHYEYLKNTTPQIIEIIKDNFNSIHNLDDVNIMDQIQRITGDVVCRLFFGKNFSKLEVDGVPITLALGSHMADIIQQQRSFSSLFFGKLLLKLNLTKRIKKISEKNKQFRELAKQTIQEMRIYMKKIKNKEDIGRKDLLQFLIDQENPQFKLSEDELIGNFLTFFFARMDTTGHLVTSLLWFLNKYPVYLDQVKNEIKTVVIHSEQTPINQTTLQQLHFLDACIKETLRVMPPVQMTILRKANQNHQLGEFNIKQNTLVSVSIWSILSGKGLNNEEEFKPERWLNGETNELESILKIPFSAGPRNCIGQHLALLEAKLITIIFLNQFKYTTIAPSEFKLTSLSLVEFKEPFRAKLEKTQ